MSARQACRALLRLLPERLLEKHRRDMEVLFLERLAAARAGGLLPAGLVWVRAVADVLSVALREPLRAWRRRALVGQPRERKPLMIGPDKLPIPILDSDSRFRFSIP